MTREFQSLCRQVRALSPPNGAGKTRFPFLTVYRFTQRAIPMPQSESFYIYAVLDGSLRLHTPSGILDYVAGQYSVSQIDTPTAGQVLSFSQAQDFLALSLACTQYDVISVVLDLDGDLPEQILRGQLEPQVVARSDRHVTSVLNRLVAQLQEPPQLDFIGRQLKRELIFSILCGSCGSQFLNSAIRIHQAGEIYEVNRWIKENFRDSFTVEELAEQRNMSVSLFHQKFKSAVGMGPLQCQKRLRLTEARRLMLDERKNVTEASCEVGYESLSQFTRDYRKMFGASPKEDILSLRGPLEK